MAIATTDLKIFKTVNGLGGVITAQESSSGVSGNVWDTFSGQETKDGGVFYACVYLKNEHVTLTAQAVEAWIETETDHDGVNVSLAKGTSAINAQEQSIANENTAPSGVVFSDTDTTTAGAATGDIIETLPDIPQGETCALWLRMTIDAGTLAKTGYAATIAIDFDTAE